MQPGQVFKPGQSSDDASNDNTSSAPGTPQPDVPTTPPTPPTDQPAQDITPPPAQPPAEEEEQVTPSADAPAESVPEQTEATNQSQPPKEEQSSDNQNRGNPSPLSANSDSQSGTDDIQQSETDNNKGEGASPEPAIQPPAEPNPDQSSNNEPENPAQFSWEASEYIEHHHSPLWYGALAAITLGFVALLVLVFKEILSALVVLLMAVAVIVYAHRKPRSLRHGVSPRGIQIGEKFYSYSEFKSFTVLGDQLVVSIELDPVKRFMPRLSMLIDQKQAPVLVDILNQHLPHEDRDPEFIDRLAHSLKF